MARLARITQKIFAATAANNGIFGSAQANAGPGVISSSLTAIMSLAAWSTGWLQAIMGGSKFPPLEEIQACEYVHSAQIAYLLNQGIAEYDAGTTYYTNQICMAPNALQMYASKTNANIGNALADTVNWKLLYDFSGGGRVLLTGAANFYVATAGNDANAGTIGSPWLTLQHAIDYITQNIDTAGFSVSINVADGTYTGGAVVNKPLTGGGILNFVGNAATPANCIISPTGADCFNISGAGVNVNIQGFRVQSTTSGSGINVSGGAIATLNGKMDFGAISGVSSAHMVTSGGGQVNVNSVYNISGGAAYHFYGNITGFISMAGGLANTSTGGAHAFTAFCNIQNLSILASITCTWAGAYTGIRYQGGSNSVIQTQGGGANYFPGNAAGTTAGGAQYL